jgi:hypothetical protein
LALDVLIDYASLVTVICRANTPQSRLVYQGKVRMLLAVALGNDQLVRGDRGTRILFCAQGSLRLINFFDKMTDDNMNPSTRQNYHQALKSLCNAVRGKDYMIQAPPALARAADQFLEQHLRAYLQRCENDRARVIGEKRAEPVFEQQDLRINFVDHERWWQLNLEELRRLQLEAANTPNWHLTYFLRFVVFLHYIPLRRSFWSRMDNQGVIFDIPSGRYLVLPPVEKSNHLKYGPRDYFQIPREHTDVMTWYIEHGRARLRSAASAVDRLDGPSDPFLLNEKGLPIRIDSITDIVRKFLYECYGLKLMLRTYRHLFAMALMSSEMEQEHRNFLVQQLRHSKATHDR